MIILKMNAKIFFIKANFLGENGNQQLRGEKPFCCFVSVIKFRSNLCFSWHLKLMWESLDFLPTFLIYVVLTLIDFDLYL